MIAALAPYLAHAQVAGGDPPAAAPEVVVTPRDVDLGYRITARLSASLEVFNLFDTWANAAAYDYVDRLPGEPAEGVDDHHVHPLEPPSARLRLTA